MNMIALILTILIELFALSIIVTGVRFILCILWVRFFFRFLIWIWEKIDGSKRQ